MVSGVHVTWFREYGVPAFKSTGYVGSRVPGFGVQSFSQPFDH